MTSKTSSAGMILSSGIPADNPIIKKRKARTKP